LGQGFVLQAQPPIPKVRCIAPQQPQTLVLSFAVADVTVPSNPGLHWTIDPFPTGEDIQVSDPALKTAIENWISEQNKLDPRMRHPWVIDGRNRWTFFNSGLSLGISADFTINPYPLVPPPSPSTPKSGGKLPVTFCAEQVPALHLDVLQIQVVSAQYDPDKSKPQRLNAKLDTGVTASALLSEDAAKPDLAAESNAFAKVAETAWQSAKQSGIVIGSDATDAVLRKAEASIAAIYNMAQNNIPFQFWGQWPEPRAIFQHTADGRCCTLTVRDVRMARGAAIQVEASLPKPTPVSADEKKSQKPDGITGNPAQVPPPAPRKSLPPRQERAEKLAERSQRTLKQRLAEALATFTNVVPTFAQIDSLRSSLSAAREIYPTVRPGISTADPRLIVFDTDNRWTILNVNLSAGGGYSVEDKGTGTVDFQGENLILQIPDSLYPKETESLTYKGGGEVQKASANWGLNWAHNYSDGAQANYGPQVSGDYSQDHNQRFGNLTGPLLRDHEIGWEPGFDYSYSSAPTTMLGNPAAHLFGLSTDAGIRQRWVRISPATGNLFPPEASGFLTAFYLDVSPSYRYQPANSAHIGGVDVTAAAHFLQGLPAADWKFTQILASAQATLYFGASHPRDFFVRFRKGMGTSNGVTPLFELFRLGGTDNTRGVEQGEQVGREIAFEQSEAGVSARQIVGWFKRAPNGSQAEETPQASPIDLTKIYLKGFYDRGRVTRSGSFADLLSFSHGAKGYGAAAELQSLSAGNKRITLSIGYARSPDSALHRKGVLITSATMDF